MGIPPVETPIREPGRPPISDRRRPAGPERSGRLPRARLIVAASLALALAGPAASEGPRGGGARGAAGPAGAADTIGAAGPAGAADTIGAAGPAGAADTIGAAGPVGATGATGPVDAADAVPTEARPLPVYADAPDDLWNRLHHLLFTETVTSCLPRYYREPGALPPDTFPEASGEARAAAIRNAYRERFSSDCRPVTRVEGGDLPELFFGDRAAFLVDEPRASTVAAALAELVADPASRARPTTARVVLQQDLWNRFDALLRLADEPGPDARREQARRLGQALGRALAALAPTAAELSRLRPNLPVLLDAVPTLAPGLLAPATPWRELVVDARGRGQTRTTAHAVTAGHRRVFRVFIESPAAAGGMACLEAAFRVRRPTDAACLKWGRLLAEGSRALLVESLVALDVTGALVPLPLVVAAQLREVRLPAPGADGRLTLEQVPVRVFHASRHALAREARAAGGLDPLPPDTPVPVLFAAFRRNPGGPLVPVALVCEACHGTDGASLMSTAIHDLGRVHVLPPGSAMAAERVVRAKRASAEYRALRRFFGAAGGPRPPVR